MSTLRLLSASRATDNAYRALADVSAAAHEVGGQWRLIGGHMVTLHTLRASVQLAARDTTDADLGATRTLAQDPDLVEALKARSYVQEGGNRFVRGPLEDQCVIDILIPTQWGQAPRHNQQVGDLSLDEAAGLRLALNRPAVPVLVEALLSDDTTLDLSVPLPDTTSAIVMKLGAYRARFDDKDVVDLHRLLEVGYEDGLVAANWPHDVEAAAAAATAHTFFVAARSTGCDALAAVHRARFRALLVHVVLGS